MKKLILLSFIATMLVGCSDHKYTFEVVHHKNLRDTIVASKYSFYMKEKIIIANESGSFTEVEWIKRID